MNLYSLFLIMKWLLVKLLLPFRKVSKKNRLLVSYELDNVKTYTSFVDDKTFPEQKFPLTAPESLSSLRETLTLASDAGLLCFCGYYDLDAKKTRRAVIWNPTVGKSVGIDVNPNTGYGRNVVGFGVCHDDPKLVNISVNKESKIKMWEVDVFTLSTRVWKNVYADVAFNNLGDLECAKVSVNGVIYFRAYNDILLAHGERRNFVISFDLKSQKFGEVRLPEILVDVRTLHVAKVNESLGILDYYNEGGMTVCGVWTTKDVANKPFTNIYTVNVEGNLWFSRILEFRNNGEVVRELDGSNEKSRLDVYEPLSRHYRDVGIDGRLGKFSVRSYPETPLLLDQPESDVIIH